MMVRYACLQRNHTLNMIKNTSTGNYKEIAKLTVYGLSISFLSDI